MRLLVWYWGKRGGGPKYTYELTKCLCESGVPKVFISISKNAENFSDFKALGLQSFNVGTYTNIITLLLFVVRFPVIYVRFILFLKRAKITHLYCPFFHHWVVFFLPVIKILGVKFLFTVHDAKSHLGERSFFLDFTVFCACKTADRIVSLTEYVKRQLINIYKIAPDKIAVVPHGIFNYSSLRNEPRTLPSENIKLLFFGRIVEYKGLDLLLSAHKSLREEYSSLRLQIAGSGNIEPYLRLLEDIDGIKVDNMWIPDKEVGKYFRNAAILVLPYLEATQSGAALIAAGAGIPVVATDVGGLSEQVISDKTGVIVEDKTSKAIAEGIEKLIKDPEFYYHCSANSISYAKGHYSWKNISKKVYELLIEL